MLKVTITEKGGAEKVLFFEDEEEVSIGRLQANRISLPKPNVSKRHAVLTLREGRVFVADLGSTNGTYVNGRRITATRELGPEDRIYIGDFTLRVRRVASRDEVSQPAVLVGPELTPAEERRPTLAVAVPLEVAAPVPESRLATPPPPPPEELSGPEPIPVDLDIEVVAEEPPSPPQGLEPASHTSQALAAAQTAAPSPRPDAPLQAADFTPAATLPGPAEPLTRRMAAVSADAEPDEYMVLLKAVADRAAEEVFAGVPAQQTQFSDEEWQALSDRVLALVDLMRRENALPAGVDAYQVTQDILFDFAGLGPLEEVLQDRTARRVLMDGPDRVFVTRGHQTTRVRRTFSAVVALERVVAKLLDLAGIAPDSVGPVAEGRLPDGTHMTVLRPPLVPEHPVVALSRPAGSLLDAPDLVRAGVMSEEVLEVIQRALSEQHNIVISGAQSTGKTTFLNAVARLLPDSARVVVIERIREVTLARGEAIRLAKDFLVCSEAQGGPCLVSRLYPDAVIIPELEAQDARLVTALGLIGQKGILTSLTAPSAQACLHRLEMLIAFGSPTVDAATVRSFVRNLVDLVVVLGLDLEGRARVTEVVALEGGEQRRVLG